jgi:hypothetical protein
VSRSIPSGHFIKVSEEAGVGKPEKRSSAVSFQATHFIGSLVD